jgi:hypothetical protein
LHGRTRGCIPPSIVNDLQGTNQTVFANPCTSTSLPSPCLTTIVDEPVNDFRSCESYSEISDDEMFNISNLFLESVIAPHDLDAMVSCLTRSTANVAPVTTPTSQCNTTCSSFTAPAVKLQDGNVVDSMTRKKLIDEQKLDDSLLECRRMADVHRNNFAWIDGVSYHYDSIAGQTVHQLVLPTSRRNEIFIMAHDKCGLQKRSQEDQ